MYRLYIRLDGLPKPVNRMLRQHWAIVKKEVDFWKLLVKTSAIGRLPDKPLEKARCIYIRHSSRAPDYDGLVSSFKAVQDGLVLAGVLKNDTVDIVKSIYLWEKCPQKEGFIEIIVDEHYANWTHSFKKADSEGREWRLEGLS
jgi:hypothetical protein